MTSETRERVRSNLEAICGSRISVDQQSLTQLQDKLRDTEIALHEANKSQQFWVEQANFWREKKEYWESEAIRNGVKAADYERKVQAYYDEHAANHEAENGSEVEGRESGDMRDVDMGKAERLETEVEVETEVPF